MCVGQDFLVGMFTDIHVREIMNPIHCLIPGTSGYKIVKHTLYYCKKETLIKRDKPMIGFSSYLSSSVVNDLVRRSSAA